ncbi:aldo/keto reductase [Amnibacterium sp. CER49]|uniref:aldo/keto reductase n=1 Tax=Amnibacterium sp. CER49 TaxID=3039161 RepID=UPI00244AF84F|nr:aldo/keto reductase [Amnibacterium sp. CER49]MDH2444025.1 aldo/keto reductase [Amnibacterium sp. CER49]
MGPDRFRPPRLGFGTAPIGGLYEAATDEEAAATLGAAWDAGFRYFDSAPHYGLGLSERRLGAALARRPRDEVVVSTKVGRLLVPDPSGAGRLDDQGFAVPATLRREWDFSRDGVLRSVEQSLERTGLDRFDVLYLHDPDQHWEQASTTGVGALIELRDQGVVRAVGAGMNQSAMLARFVRETDVDLVMLAGRFTLIDQSALDDLLPLALERSVGVVAVGVYNSGLTSRATVSDDTTYDYAAAPAERVERARRIAAVCEAHGTTLPEAALAFPRRHPAVVSVVVGVRGVDQVAETVQRDRAAVPDALWQELEAEGLIRALS